MPTWLQDIYTNKRWLFYILIPVVILYFLRDFLMGATASSASKDLAKAENKDRDLENQAREAQGRAQENVKQADKAAETVKKIAESDVSEDWHKNYKKPE